MDYGYHGTKRTLGEFKHHEKSVHSASRVGDSERRVLEHLKIGMSSLNRDALQHEF